MMTKNVLSQRASGGKPSATLAIAAKAKKMKAEGIDVVSFAAGEPDFKTPPHICAAGIKAINEGLHFYLPNAGMPSLKTAVSERFQKDIGVHYTPEQILVSPGAKYSLFLAFAALLDEGDEMLLPSPFWVSYPEMAQIFGATTRFIEMDTDFVLTAAMVEKAITPQTKLLVLNSPCNPTGSIIAPEEIKKIGALVEKYGLYCISDEIYDKLIYGDAKHLSIASVSDYCATHTLVVNGCSKTYSMTGWRIGYAAGSAEIIKAMDNIQSQSTSNACSIAQAAAVAALTGDQSCVETMRQSFQARRDLMVKLLNDIAGVKCHTPAGAFYVLPNISAVLGKTISGRKINTPTDLCNLALDEFHVACVPGEAFGTDKHIRLSYATSNDAIEKGSARLKKMIEG